MDNNNPVKELIDEQLTSDINEILETVEAGVESFGKHTKDLNNPHQVTKEQVGLGNADNTSDMDKPISHAVSSAIKSLEGKISGVDSAVKTLENKVDSAVNTLNDKVDSAVNTINGDIAQVKSSVETFKHEINSAIQTLEHGFDSDLETAKQEILDVVDGFKVNLNGVASSVETLKSQTQSAIETNKTEVLNTVSGIKTSLQSAIDTNKANAESAINTLNQNLNGVKSALQTHNHDEMYCKKSHTHTAYVTNTNFAETNILKIVVDTNYLGKGYLLKDTYLLDGNVIREISGWIQSKEIVMEKDGMGFSGVVIVNNDAPNKHYTGTFEMGEEGNTITFTAYIQSGSSFVTDTSASFFFPGTFYAVGYKYQ